MYEYLSECCDSRPAMEIDESTMTGFCGHCLDDSGFYREEIEPPWDTREEKYGER